MEKCVKKMDGCPKVTQMDGQYDPNKMPILGMPSLFPNLPTTPKTDKDQLSLIKACDPAPLQAVKHHIVHL